MRSSRPWILVILGAVFVIGFGFYRYLDFGNDLKGSFSKTGATVTQSLEADATLQSSVVEPVPSNTTAQFSVTTPAPSTITSSSSNTITNSAPPVSTGSRGYMTTPQELNSIAHKADLEIQPYKSAVHALLEYVREPSYWPEKYPSIEGSQSCDETKEPRYIFEGSPLAFAKAMAYHITGVGAYAADVKTRILDLTDTTGYGGDEYSGANQCILNLSWYIPGWIMAADLIDDYPGWKTADKVQFQQWLAEVVYEKTAWSSRNRKNNWGSAGSTTSGMIADYLWDSPFLLEGDAPRDAYKEHRQHQLDRMGTLKPFDSVCDIWGIQSDGGIPDELVRGSSGCKAQWIHQNDESWMYTMTFMQGLVMHAEFLLRRGDKTLFENIASDGSGSILKAIHFVIDNPIKPDKSTDWRAKQILEVTYRYYRDAVSAQQLGIGQSDRYIGDRSGQMFHFGTITHGFAVDEHPGLPPSVPPP